MRILLTAIIFFGGCASPSSQNPTKGSIDSLIANKSPFHKFYEDSVYHNDIKPNSASRKFYCNNVGDLNLIKKEMVFPDMRSSDAIYFTNGNIIKIISDYSIADKKWLHFEYYINHDSVFAKYESDSDYSIMSALPNLIFESKADYRQLDSVKMR